MSDVDQLTDKQRRFCEEYVLDWNATQAAIRAGYSEKTAHAIGQENLRKPIIKSFIDECRERTSELAGVSALRNAIELKKIAYTTLSSINIDWNKLREWDDLSEDQKAIISDIEYTTRSIETGEGAPVILETRVKVKTHDRLRAIDMLNKMIPGAMTPTRTESRHKVDFGELNDDQLNDEIRRLEGLARIKERGTS